MIGNYSYLTACTRGILTDPRNYDILMSFFSFFNLTTVHYIITTSTLTAK